MKLIKRSVLVALSVLLCTTTSAQDPPRKVLKFNEKGTFKMVQFTDIHFGEDEADDLDNQRLMGDILDQEQPDLVICSGDAVSGYAWDGKTKPWAALQYANFTKPMMKRGIYWATTAGNHDEEADLNREEISEVDRSFNLSLTLPN